MYIIHVHCERLVAGRKRPWSRSEGQAASSQKQSLDNATEVTDSDLKRIFCEELVTAQFGQLPNHSYAFLRAGHSIMPRLRGLVEHCFSSCRVQGIDSYFSSLIQRLIAPKRTKVPE